MILSNFIPSIIVFILLIIIVSAPRLDEDLFRNKVLFEAEHYEKDNRYYLKFRDNQTFELTYYGLIGSSIFTGSWQQKEDTIRVSYSDLHDKKPILNETLLLKNDSLIILKSHSKDKNLIYYTISN